MEIRTAYLSTKGVPYPTREEAIKSSILATFWNVPYGDNKVEESAPTTKTHTLTHTDEEVGVLLETVLNAAFEEGFREGRKLDPTYIEDDDDDDDDDDEDIFPLRKKTPPGSKVNIPLGVNPRKVLGTNTGRVSSGRHAND